MSVAISTNPEQRGQTPDTHKGALQRWTMARRDDLLSDGSTTWSFAFDVVSQEINTRNSSLTTGANITRFCGGVAEKLCALTRPHRIALSNCFRERLGSSRAKDTLLENLLSENQVNRETAAASIGQLLEVYAEMGDLLTFMKCCVVIELCHKAGETAPIHESTLVAILMGRKVAINLSGAATAIAGNDTLLTSTVAPAQDEGESCYESYSQQRQQQDQAQSEKALAAIELVKDLPTHFLARLAELSHIFGNLEGSTNPNTQSLGTFQLPAGCRSYFTAPTREQFALLDTAANDLEFKTQVIAFVGRMIKNGFDTQKSGLTSTEHREFDQLLIGFMHNFAVAHKKSDGSNNVISQNFRSAVGYSDYWDGDTHYLERTNGHKRVQFSRDLNAAESDTSTTFPMCIALAIRLYENISGTSLTENHTEPLTPNILDDSVLPPKLKARFDQLLTGPEVDRTNLNALQKAVEQLEAVGMYNAAVVALKQQIAEEELKISLVPEIKNREAIELLRERAIQIFAGGGAQELKRSPLAELESFSSEPYYAEGSPQFKHAILNRTLTENQFGLEPFRRNWLEDCILRPPSNDTQEGSTSGTNTLIVRHPNETALILSRAGTLGAELSTALKESLQVSVGYLIETAPERDEARKCLELIQSVTDQGGAIAKLRQLTPEELRDLSDHINAFRVSYPEDGRVKLLDLLRNRGIDQETYSEYEDFIEGLLKRNYDKDDGESINFWKRTDLKLIMICVRGHQDLKKISGSANIDEIVSGVNVEKFTDEDRELVINRLATVLFMAERYRGRIERTVGAAAGELVKATLEHYRQVPELQEEIKAGRANNLNGCYIINTLQNMVEQYQKVEALTPKQIEFADLLVAGYKAILFEIMVKLRQNSADDEGPLMIHQRTIP